MNMSESTQETQATTTPAPPPNVDPEVWQSLPEDIQAELLREAAREAARSQSNNAAGTGAQEGASGTTTTTTATQPPQSEVNIAQFLATLPPDLRNQVLLTATPEEVARMPPELRAEVDRVRLQAAVEQGNNLDRNLYVRDNGEISYDGDERDDGDVEGQRRSHDTFTCAEIPGKPVLRNYQDAAMIVKLLGMRRSSQNKNGKEVDGLLVSLSLHKESRPWVLRALLEKGVLEVRRPKIEILHFLQSMLDSQKESRELAVAEFAGDMFALLGKIKFSQHHTFPDTEITDAILKVFLPISSDLKGIQPNEEEDGLKALSNLLSWDDCPEDTFNLASKVAKNLVAAEPTRSKILLAKLIEGTEPLGHQVAQELHDLTERLQKGGSAEDEPVRSSEMRLLRAVQTIKNLKGDSGISINLKLDETWNELSKALKIMEARILEATKAAAAREKQGNSAGSSGAAGSTDHSSAQSHVAALNNMLRASFLNVHNLPGATRGSANFDIDVQVSTSIEPEGSSAAAAAPASGGRSHTIHLTRDVNENILQMVRNALGVDNAVPATVRGGGGGSAAAAATVPGGSTTEGESRRDSDGGDEAAVARRMLERQFIQAMQSAVSSDQPRDDSQDDEEGEEEVDEEDSQDDPQSFLNEVATQDQIARFIINQLENMEAEDENDDDEDEGDERDEDDEDDHDEDDEEDDHDGNNIFHNHDDEEDGEEDEEHGEEEEEEEEDDEDREMDDDYVEPDFFSPSENVIEEIMQWTNVGGDGGLFGMRQLTRSQNSRAGHLLKVKVPGLARFLPCIEAFFEANDDELAVEKFGNDHSLVLNTLVRSSVKLLNDSLKALATRYGCRKVLTFENKRAYFKQGIRQMSRPLRPLRLNLRRDHVFEDSMAQLATKTPDEMRANISVVFRGEEGIDAGGVTREWFAVLIREMFRPDYAIFKQSADSSAFQPDPRSYVNPEHLSWFKFVGRIIGKALLEGHYIAAHFTRSFYKHVLGREVTVNDLQSLDPQFHKSLISILEMPDVSLLDLNFTLDVEEFGVRSTVELIPNGANTPVTEQNKHEWVKLAAQQKMTGAIRAQINAFLTGFYEIIPKEYIQIFNPQELELMISGMPKIDLDDLMRNTDYNGGYARDAEQIGWFWKILRTLDEADKARFLMFVTGTSKVPLEGFANLVGMRGIQRFSIHRGPTNDATLPTAHTCFNQLDLPAYSSEAVMRDKLMMAIREGSEGFGFA